MVSYVHGPHRSFLCAWFFCRFSRFHKKHTAAVDNSGSSWSTFEIFSKFRSCPWTTPPTERSFAGFPQRAFCQKGSGYGSVLQANRNKIQHSLHGNTTLYLTQLLPLATPPVTLNLSELLPVPQCTTDPQKYSRSLLLAARPIAKLGQALISLAPRTKPPLTGHRPAVTQPVPNGTPA